MVEALQRDYRTAPISDADKAMLAHVEKLTRHAYKVTPEDLDGLRVAGFDDQAILQITMIAAWFNYINRMADALGVGRDLPAAAEFVKE